MSTHGVVNFFFFLCIVGFARRIHFYAQSRFQFSFGVIFEVFFNCYRRTNSKYDFFNSLYWYEITFTSYAGNQLKILCLYLYDLIYSFTQGERVLYYKYFKYWKDTKNRPREIGRMKWPTKPLG